MSVLTYPSVLDGHILPALGESLPATAKLLGHRKVSTMARYLHLMRGADRVDRSASR